MTTTIAPARDRFLTVKDYRVRVRQQGKGTPLLLINGLGGCIEGWEPLARRLSGRRLVMVDHPGTGLSDTPSRVLSMTDIAALYIGVLDSLKIDRADVLGFSFGGAVAQQLAKDYPDRVSSITLASTAFGWGGIPANPFTLWIASNPLRYQFVAVREMSAPLLYRGRAGRDPELFKTELRGWSAHQASTLGVSYQIAAYAGWSSMPWLCTLRVPTLVLGGEQDPMAPVINSRMLAAAVPGAELHVIKGGGHLFPFDQAEEVSLIITHFLDRQHAVAAA